MYAVRRVPCPCAAPRPRVQFCAYDLRLMELAVALSKYVSEDDPLPLVRRFASGYGKHGQLTPAEIELIPDAINLR